MLVDGLQIPGALLALIDAGIWPQNADDAMKQHLRPIVSRERIATLAPGEHGIYLYPPPFHTLAADTNTKDGADFWWRFGALHEILPEASVMIGDFGIGSDAPIILDYRKSLASPRVLRLKWSRKSGKIDNYWICCAENFEILAATLGLANPV